MYLALLGLNHESAPLDLRERLAICKEDMPDALNRLYDIDGVTECLILSTCNRTEILAAFEPGTLDFAKLTGFLASTSNVTEADFEGHLYRHLNQDAVLHVFKVATSLDSMVVGETQITGQVKDAYSGAVAAQTTGPLLNKLMHIAFRVAKRVRTQTCIGTGTLSVSQVACDLACKIFSNLQDRTVLLLGAGEAAELAAKILKDRGVSSLQIANRTEERARQVAEGLGAAVIPFDDLSSALNDSDIVIASTGSAEPILTRHNIEPALHRRKRPIFIIDMAVPRDVDPAVDDLDGVFRYDIDDLGKYVRANQMRRQSEWRQSIKMVEEDRDRFMNWYANFKVTPTIKDLQMQVERIRSSEMDRLRDKLSPEDFEIVEQCSKRMMKKLMVNPILYVKDASTKPDSKKLISAIREFLGLVEEKS